MLTKLRHIVEQVASAEQLDDALNLLVQQTCDAMQTDCCSIYIADHRQSQFRLMASKGLSTDRLIQLKMGEGLVGWVAKHAEPINLADACEHPNFKHLPGIGEEAFRAFLATPIIYRKAILGVLVVQQRQQRLFDESEESFLVTLAAQLAVVISHAKSQGKWQPSSVGVGIHYTGSAASSGVAVAKGWWDDSQPRLEQVHPSSALSPDLERERLSFALDAADQEFRRLRKRFDGDLQKDSLAIFDLFSHLLHDPMLRNDLSACVEDGDSAEWAVRQVVERYFSRFSAMADPYLRERAGDMRELGQRLLYFLSRQDMPQTQFAEPTVLFARELTASMLATIPREQLAAVVSQEGAVNSHAAILARSLGIPAIMGVDFTGEGVANRRVIVDGYRGDVFIDPNVHIAAEYLQLLKEEQALTELVEQDRQLAATTACGTTIGIHLNAGLSSDIGANQGIDGVGLYRTEVPFLLQSSFPSEEEQTKQYREMLQTYHPLPVVMRTLDVGGDKCLPYLSVEEDNPFLGWRGIRFTLDHPDIFLIQLRAMLRASLDHENLAVLFPMVSGIAELDEAINLFERAVKEIAQEAAIHGHTLQRPKLGVMLEVPSMLYLLTPLLPRIDFMSVGSNDLTQYLLAVDRNNARVASLYDPLHPAVLQALKQIIDFANIQQLPVSVCGELAGDPLGALLLTGMGYRSLSMNPRNVARIKYLLRQFSLAELEAAASEVLQCYASQKIHLHLSALLEQRDLGGFIRAGK
ncbi:Phosphoenolpyruvate-dependent phosphotransferase system [Vibrio stylophorae]|uniref:phosphoenolpyruvate--protein phosphotransferase n=1 Tax=Vibrio stylophorae TaxID=659351 RepID=A0ABM8ZS20_9VIBR|nr:phosphoenolpyruvate--protein phosphotransferase [Vibrio stylophorae]CAH0532686.1 Phosphoenolpyruvate-dependent phosphotransferase system [Vibrio stylophorae]